MEKSEYPQLDEGLDKKVFGYKGIEYSLYELRNSANNFRTDDAKCYRNIAKSKYSKIYNCESETIPANLLEEVYGLSKSFKEIWREVPDNKKYTVSNLGRIRLNGVLVHQDDENYNGILRMTDTIEKKRSDNISKEVYDFIAKAFLGETSNKHVHHINNNGYDCRPENLILLEKKQHSIVHNFPVSELTEDPTYGQ